MQVQDVLSRIRNKALQKKVVSPESAARFIEDGMTVGTSGGIGAPYPKAVFSSLKLLAKNGYKPKIDLWTTALLPYEIDGILTEEGLLKRRLGSHINPILNKAVNDRKVQCFDIRSGFFPHLVNNRLIGKIDLAIVDAVGITERGDIIPTTVLGDLPSSVQSADSVIVEINMGHPIELEGMHDVYYPGNPPNRKPIPIFHVSDRIGTPFIPAGEEKIKYIVGSKEQETSLQPVVEDEISRGIANHLIQFFKEEVRKRRLPDNLLPLEIGLGSVADCILRALVNSGFRKLEIFTAVIGGGVLKVIESGNVLAVSTNALLFCLEDQRYLYQNLDRFKNNIIIRPVDVTNAPEVIARLGVISINSALEVDIYGHVNSSHLSGFKLVNGIGGSSEFAANGYLSVFTIPSTARNGKVSTIVPMATHVDHSEHVVDIIVTEQGWADLRGLSPVERAEQIISRCVHPSFKAILLEYLNEAIRRCGGHEPCLLEEAFSWFKKFQNGIS